MDAITDPLWTSATLPDSAASGSHESAALVLACRGIPVFPCAPGAKTPLTTHGFHDATTDPRAIATWWAAHPDANIGLPTGAVSGMDVVDVDVHDGASGFPAWEAARRAGIFEGWAWLVRTPSGGLHAYFPHPAGVEQRSWQAPNAHVDFRGDGGYVIVPPSRIVVCGEPRIYDVIATAPHRPAPVDAAALRRFLDPPPPPRPQGMPARVAGTDPHRLAGYVRESRAGGRNRALFWASCRMVEASFDFPSTLGALGSAAVEAGLDEREVLTTVRSAFRTTSAGRERPAPALQADRALSVSDGVSATEGVAR